MRLMLKQYNSTTVPKVKGQTLSVTLEIHIQIISAISIRMAKKPTENLYRDRQTNGRGGNLQPPFPPDSPL